MSQVILRGCAIIAVLLIAPAVGAQSLAELSKREKQRRESNDSKDAVVKAYTDADIGRADEDEGDETQESEKDGEETSSDSTSEVGLDAWLDDKGAEKQAWRVRLAEYQRRFTQEKGRLAMLRTIEAECKSDAMPIGIVSEPLGMEQAQVTWGSGQVTCENLPGLIESVSSTMNSIEVECATDARQHFIPPLEAKLH